MVVFHTFFYKITHGCMTSHTRNLYIVYTLFSIQIRKNTRISSSTRSKVLSFCCVLMFLFLFSPYFLLSLFLFFSYPLLLCLGLQNHISQKSLLSLHLSHNTQLNLQNRELIFLWFFRAIFLRLFL